MTLLKCMLMVALLCGVTNAQTTALMNYQGQLSTSGGSPANGTFSISFALYSAPSGGSPLWTETQSVAVSAGSFSVLLGSVTPLPDSIMTSDYALYLGTTVGGDTEMSPRTRLVSVPSAARVRSIEGAHGGTIDQGIFLGADSTTSDSVGLGSASKESGARAPIPCTDLSKRMFAQLGNTIGSRFGLLTLTDGASTTISLQGCNGNMSASGNLRMTGTATFGYNSLNLGIGNFIAGGWSSIVGDSSTICGGNTNMIYGNYAVLSGGLHNRINSSYGTIGGGELNKVDGLHGTVPGGKSNTATGAYSFAAGSSATALGDRSFVWNGKGTPFSSTTAPSQFLINCDSMGINTNSPGRLLDVNGSFRTKSFEMPTGASNGFVLTSNASGVGTWQAASGGTPNGWIDDGVIVRLQTSSDKVGIGTSSPIAKLSVQGDISCAVGTSSASNLTSLLSKAHNEGTGRATGGEFEASGASGTGIHMGVYALGSGSTSDNRGIWASAFGNSGSSFGVLSFGQIDGGGNGTAYGANCTSQNLGTGDAYGAKMYGAGGSGSNYGIWAQSSSTGGGTNYGVYGLASGGTTNWAGWFSGNVKVTGTLGTNSFEMPTGASNGYVLTSSSSGVGTWQAASGGTANGWVDDGTNVRLQTATDNVGIGTASPLAKLHVAGSSYTSYSTSSSGEILGSEVVATNSSTGGATGGGFRALGPSSSFNRGVYGYSSGSLNENTGVFGDAVQVDGAVTGVIGQGTKGASPTATGVARGGYFVSNNPGSGVSTGVVGIGGGSGTVAISGGIFQAVGSGTGTKRAIEAYVSGEGAEIRGAVIGATSANSFPIGINAQGTVVTGGSSDATGAYVSAFNNGSGSAVGCTGYASVSSASSSYGGNFQASSSSGTGTTYGVYASSSGGATNYAGYFAGNVNVTGTLSKAGGSFKIDHPLDPGNKYLQHSFVESPDMMNIYNGNITTDANGTAIVTLPDYFESLNREFRYQLTVIGQFAQAIVATEISGATFTIKTDKPHVKVSWQVTGVRKDAWAEKNRIQVEVDKPADQRGKYLHPGAFGKSIEQSVDYENSNQARESVATAPAPIDTASRMEQHR